MTARAVIGLSRPVIQRARSRRVRRLSDVLSSRPGRKLGVAGVTKGPVSSCQLPRCNKRTGIGGAASVTIVMALPPRVSLTFATARW